MRARCLVLLAAAFGVYGCELPVDASDRVVTMTADWTPPAGPFAANATVPGQPAVVLTDAQGRPRAGVPVYFQPIVPPLVVVASVDTTDADGRAVMPATWQLGSQPGTHSLIVHVPTGQSSPPVVFEVEVVATP